MGERKGSWAGDKGYYYCKDGKDDSKSNKSWKNSQSHASKLSTEKKFIEYLTSITWRRLCDAQKFRRPYKNIDQWDDSGALESFRTARSRFEALHYITESTIPPLSDPNMFIDQIDHDLVIDREIIADIERALEPDETAELARTGLGKSGWDSVEFVEKSVPVSGWESWGDNEEKEKENESNNWDNYVEEENRSTNWGKYVEKENGSNNWDKYVDKKSDSNNCWEKKGDCGDNDNKWNNENRAWGNKEAPCSLVWDKWEDRCNSVWSKLWNSDDKRVWGNKKALCSSSWEREECSFNKAWNSNSWDRRNSDWNRRNIRKRDGNGVHAGFRVRKIRFKGQGCNNGKGARERNTNPIYPYNISYS